MQKTAMWQKWHLFNTDDSFSMQKTAIWYRRQLFIIKDGCVLLGWLCWTAISKLDAKQFSVKIERKQFFSNLIASEVIFIFLKWWKWSLKFVSLISGLKSMIMWTRALLWSKNNFMLQIGQVNTVFRFTNFCQLNGEEKVRLPYDYI